MDHLLAQWRKIADFGTFRERLSHCYQLAGMAVVFDGMGDLIHGTIEGAGEPPLGHAWVDTGSGIFDAVLRRNFSYPEWKAFASPVEVRRYTAAEAGVKMLQTEHWGPWHPTDARGIPTSAVKTAMPPQMQPWEQEWFDKVMAGVGPIYRGYSVEAPESLRQEVWALLDPPMEEHQINQHFKAGPIILDYLERSHPNYDGSGLGLGRHWTTSRHFAEVATSHGNIGGNFGVLLTAEYEPSMVDQEMSMTTPGMARAEEEVTLKPGAMVTVTAVQVMSVISRPGFNLLERPVRARV